MGKIAKLQKSRKNKKLKTVEKSFFDKSDSAADKCNLKPSDIHEQEVPRSVREIMRFKEDSKLTKKKKMKRKPKDANWNEDETMVRGMSRPMKPVPKFKKGKRESEKQFMNRVNRTVQSVIQKSQFEDKYNVDLDETGGKVEIKKKKKEKTDHQKERQQIKTEKKKAKKHKSSLKKATGFEQLQDSVQFGEVAQAPPQFSAKPRKSEEKSNKPGQKSLLLKTMLDKNKPLQSHKWESSDAQRQVGQSIKRKHMSMAQQRIMDGEREKAIQLYRDLKLKQMASSS